jgi:LysM repeat protein
MRAVLGHKWVGRLALVCAAALLIGGAFDVRPSAAQTGGTSYTVQPGDTLGSIAQRYGVTTAALMQENGLSDVNTVWSGQLLTIPAAAGSAPDAQPTATPGDTSTGAGVTSTYTIQSGDQLSDIARANGVSLAALMAANGITNADLIRVGQTLIIPAAATAQPAATPQAAATVLPTTTPVPQATAAPSTYTVQAGDTLASIAQSQGVSLADLMAANQITNPDLVSSGQQLTIPRPTPVPTRAAAAAASGAAATGPTAGPGQIIYTVVSGDTLAKIAARYRSSAATLGRLNHLDSMDQIVPGMQLTIPAYAQAAKNWPGSATRVVVSITQQRCWVYQASTIIGDWPCSTGRKGFETRPGVYKIKTKLDKAWGSAWSFWMPNWLGIYDAGSTEDGFHGLPFGPNGQQHLWEGFVGTPITFGCILLDAKHAQQLYDMAYIGMPVVVQP